MASADDLSRVLDQLDGVVMVGGADLDPRRDGFMLHPAVRTMEERREDFDRLLMSQVAERRLPVLAIGATATLAQRRRSRRLQRSPMQ